MVAIWNKLYLQRYKLDESLQELCYDHLFMESLYSFVILPYFNFIYYSITEKMPSKQTKSLLKRHCKLRYPDLTWREAPRPVTSVTLSQKKGNLFDSRFLWAFSYSSYSFQEFSG